MTDNTGLIDAVTAVSEAAHSLSDSSPVGPVQAEAGHMRALISAVEETATAARNYVTAPVTKRVAKPELAKSIRETCVALLRHGRVEPLEGLHPSPAIHPMLRREWDENLHSDYHAALMDPQEVDEFAHHLFAALFAAGSRSAIDPATIAFQMPYRELHLDEIDIELQGDPRGARRIDVLVKTDQGTLVIENKLLSWELERQTLDYRDAVQARYPEVHAARPLSFLMLSPGGLAGEATEFKGISYLDLARILNRVLRGGTWSPGATKLAIHYLQELNGLFVQPAVDSQAEARVRLKGEGYDV